MAYRFLFLMLLVAVSAVASQAVAVAEDGSPDLLRAVTLCPEPNNPLTNGLGALGANLFGSVTTQASDAYPGATLIKADLIQSPHAKNEAIMAPDRIVGRIELSIGYGTGHVNRPLSCVLVVIQSGN